MAAAEFFGETPKNTVETTVPPRNNRFALWQGNGRAATKK
jgi:hypothetical protein